MIFTRRHEQELGELKALAHEVDQRARGVQERLERIGDAQERQLTGRGQRGTRTGIDADGGGPLVAFVHIPKTAGGTATTMFQAAYSRRGINKTGNYVRGAEKTAHKVARPPGGWENWRRSGGRVAVGHTPYGLFRKNLPPGTRYMTFLREPVDRVLSHYYRHIHFPELSPGQRRARNERGRETAASLEEALVELRVPQLTNLCTRFLCGHDSPMGELPESAVEDAKANLRGFAFLGIQERFEESIVLLQRMLGLGLVPYLNRHVSLEGRRPTVDEISEEERALITECNRLDVELYAFGLELFEEAVEAAGDGFAVDVAELRSLSAETNEEAIRTAREWLDSAGAGVEASELRPAAREAGVSIPALKQVLASRR